LLPPNQQQGKELSIAPILSAIMRLIFLAAGTKELWTVTHRLALAFRTLPDPPQWTLTAGLLLRFALIACPVGFMTGFLKIEAIRSWRALAALLLVTLVSPAILEETIYRVALLPYPSERMPAGPLLAWLALSLLLFVPSHLVSLPRRSSARAATFRQPLFLSLAALLGLVCAAAYLQSGSIWPPVVIHWLIVFAWLGFLGGYRHLFSAASPHNQRERAYAGPDAQ
jgi:predicted Abi (CAAX) family protease